MRRRWEAFVRFAGERERGTVLALMRIAVGLITFGSILENILYGVVELIWIDKRAGGAFSLGGNWVVRALGGPTPTVVWALMLTSMAGGLALAIGFGGRLTALVTLQAYGAVTTLNGNAGGGYDALLTNAMWVLFIGGASATMSLDCKLRTKRWFDDRPIVPAIARRFAIFQVLVVYGMTGLQKLSPVWTPAGGYSALYWVFQEPTWRRIDMTWTAKVYPLTQLATAVTWHFETGALLMLLFYWYRATPDRKGLLRRWANRFDLRIPFLATGVMLHIGILAALAVGPFSFASVAFYIAFVRPDEATKLWAWWKNRGAKSTTDDRDQSKTTSTSPAPGDQTADADTAAPETKVAPSTTHDPEASGMQSQMASVQSASSV